jgi:predicted permease
MWRRYLRFLGPDVEADVRDELQFHIETKIGELIAEGFGVEEARREALRRFGDLSEINKLCRSIGEAEVRKRNMGDLIGSLWYEIRQAVRSHLRAPRFALVAILTLAGGLFGAASLFSIVDSWIIRSVRFPEPHQLIFATGNDAAGGREVELSFADYADTAARSRCLRSLSAWTEDSFTLSLEGPSERVSGARVSTNLFETLAVKPALGRAFLSQEGEIGRDRVAIVSYGFWKARLNGDPSAIGSALHLNHELYTVVGVMPEKFHFTLVGRANVWVPLAPWPEERARRRPRSLQLIGRLKPNVTLVQAREELNSIAAQLAGAYPETNRAIALAARGLSEEIGRHTGQNFLLIVFGVTLGLLLITCSNIGSLIMVQAVARQREAAIQLSVGASTGRIVRQRLTETLVLFIAAALISAAAASWANKTITAIIPFENRGYLPGYGEAPLNWSACGFVLLIALITGISFGLAPAREAACADLSAALKASGSSPSVKTNRRRLTLVVAQIFLATILASATVMLVQSFRNLLRTPLGFDDKGVLTFRVSLNERQYPDRSQTNAFLDSLLSRLNSPQFGKPAAAATIPFGDSQSESTFRLKTEGDDNAVNGSQPPSAGFNAVSPEYFSVLRVPLRAGRYFEMQDSRNAPPVAIVNELFAKRYLAGRNAIGESIALGKIENRSATIVGVVGATREDGDPDSTHPQIYVPLAQSPDNNVFIIARPDTDPLKLAPDARRALAALDPGQPIYDVKSLAERVNEAFVPYLIIGGLLIWFGALAVALTGVGIYGVMAFSVSQRTREIGIRAALGADRLRLQVIFVRQGIFILTAGLVPGLLSSIAVCIAIRSILDGVVPLAMTRALLFTTVLVICVVMIAMSVPAHRAGAVDPISAIRHE